MYPNAFSSLVEAPPDPLAVEVNAMIVDNRILIKKSLCTFKIEFFQQIFQNNINQVFQIYCNPSLIQNLEKVKLYCTKDQVNNPDVFIDNIDTDEEADSLLPGDFENQLPASLAPVPDLTLMPNYNQ